MRTDIGAFGRREAHPDASQASINVDCLIVGAGFGGVYLLHHLRKAGYSCKIFEAGSDLGGIWHWNCYPGARVDSPVPVYEYSIPEVYESWNWTVRYPGWKELRRYFDHVDKVLDIKKDVIFNTKVNGAEHDEGSGMWKVQTEDGKIATARFLIIAAGFAAKRHFPDWKGLDTFKGEVHHSSFWPQNGVDVKGKRVGVVGTGSTGIQISQEVAHDDIKSLTVFQRTPNLALPMGQEPLTEADQDKSTYAEFFKHRMTTFGGFPYDFRPENTLNDSPEEREAFFEKIWAEAGFHFWLATYQDMLFDNDANRAAYDFWSKKTRARIKDPVKRDILAPLEPPHPFGTKRPSLEQDFYEMMDKENVKVVDIKNNPVIEVRENGILTSDGEFHELDVMALATGFDSVTGGMKNMGLRSTKGENLADLWQTGTWSYLGMTINNFPNMFFLYGPQGPTAFSNGPSCVEAQGDWIVDAIAKMREEGLKSINATREAEEEWRDSVQKLSDATLFPIADSWYMGANIPGKPREQLNYPGGIPKYEEEIRKSLNNNWVGFETAKAAA